MMLQRITILYVLVLQVLVTRSQDTILLSPKDYEDVQEIYPAKKHGWYFKQGADSVWLVDGRAGKGWKRLRPVEINAAMTDTNGVFEGWFRAVIKIDSGFGNTRLSVFLGTRAAQDIFIDGILYYSTGNTGLNGQPYKENESIYQFYPARELPSFTAGSTHTILWHIKDCWAEPFSSNYLKSELSGGLHNSFEIVSPDFVQWQKARAPYITAFSLLGNSIVFILFVLFLLLWLLNKDDRDLMRFTVFCGIYFLALTVSSFEHSVFYPVNISYLEEKVYDFIGSTLVIWFVSYAPFLLAKLDNSRYSNAVKWLVPISLFLHSVGFYYYIDSNNKMVISIIFILNLLISLYFVINLFRSGKKVNRIIVFGVLGSLFFISFLPLMTPVYGYKLFFFFGFLSSISFPLSLMVYTAVRFKTILRDVKSNAETIITLSEEKRFQAEQQQHILKEEVAKQTLELRNSLQELKTTQSQLIQSEKMASLGELTAGIAHEIQNPLNFVNNFSEVSKELIEEVKSERAKVKSERDEGLEEELLEDISQNLEKINHHGKRADAIVKGMLAHSRTSSGKKEPTDLNALAEEYLRLSYHGLKAKDASFAATFHFEPDNNLPKVNVVPQDIGRVLLNLINNAFYAVHERSKKGEAGYKPEVVVSTASKGSFVKIMVKDNGGGIPESIQGKIFQPFFTTKPTGEGTGLGLSLSYDIVTKGHGGELFVSVIDMKFTIFTIVL